jgi:hypothetical protein
MPPLKKLSDDISTNIYFGTFERREKLQAMARAQGISQSELVRRWIDSMEEKVNKGLKLCVECKWVKKNAEMERWDCVHVNRGQSLVDGKYKVKPCEAARSVPAGQFVSTDCGPEGKWWEEKILVVEERR